MIVPPAWGIPAILVVGIAVVFFGWWWDRRATRLASEGYTPQSEVDAAEPPASLDEARLAALLDQLPDTAQVATTASERFLPLPAPRGVEGLRGRVAALERPLVLLADADLSDPIALVPALRHAQSEDRPLVLVARSISDGIADTLEANARTGRLTALPLSAEPAVLAQLSELTCATPLGSQDWTAGWLPSSAWGTVDGWVCDARRSWLILPR